MMKRIAKLGLILIMGASMSACSGLLPHGMSWKEEVQLHDGRVILVERNLKLGGYSTLDARERKVLGETLNINLPGSHKRITWKTDYRDAEPEPNSLGPLLLGIVDDVPYLATSPAGCIAYNKWKRPNPPYILFKYTNDVWQQIPMQEFPEQLVIANLMGRPASSLLQSYYTVAEAKAKREDGNRADYAKTILREPKPNAGSNCGEMVYDGHGGWIGIGWFRKQPSNEACLIYCEREKVPAQYCPCNKLFKGK